MSILDWSFLNPVGRAVIAIIETVISLSAITSLLSLSAAQVATWVMQVTTHQAGLDSSIARLALAQRIALAALVIFLMLNVVTPFITPDPPWLANLPLVVAITAFRWHSACHTFAPNGREDRCKRTLGPPAADSTNPRPRYSRRHYDPI